MNNMMIREITYIIPAQESCRLSTFLRRKGYSRQNLVEMKKYPDCAMVNGDPAHFNVPVRSGDRVVIRIRETHEPTVLPVRLPIKILYEDEDLLIVDKPAGMPTHPSFGNYDNTLANAVTWHCCRQDPGFVFRCSNRLDRDTSGLTVVAKHFVSAGMLSEMGVRHAIRRDYLAIVRGVPQPSSGTIDKPLGRKPGSILERTIDPDGEQAVTHYHVLETKNGHSLVSLTLETGRTHQIRIHMKSIGYPLIGDYLYNPDFEYISRQALHAHRLRFTQPLTGKALDFVSELPEDMRHVLEQPRS